MSGINGDKARFHRRRKQKIERRIRQREMFGGLPRQSKRTSGQSETQPKEKLA